jgi:hypothetical protein
VATTSFGRIVNVELVGDITTLSITECACTCVTHGEEEDSGTDLSGVTTEVVECLATVLETDDFLTEEV